MADEGMRIFLTLLVLLIAPARADDLPRVVSLNLCADAYLMAFGTRAQILALTPQSQDPSLSAFHAEAKSYPISDGQIETIAALDPDLVIVSSYSDPMRKLLVKTLGIEIITLDAANSYAAARAEIMRLGTAIGRSAQARAYVADLDRQMAALTPPRRRLKTPRILPLQRRNLTIGGGHIVDEIIALAGGENIGRQTTGAPMGRISLEHALTVEADYILSHHRDARPDTRGMEFLTHPALALAYPPQKRLSLDSHLVSCAGATTPLAVKKLIEQLDD